MNDELHSWEQQHVTFSKALTYIYMCTFGSTKFSYTKWVIFLEEERKIETDRSQHFLWKYYIIFNGSQVKKYHFTDTNRIVFRQQNINYQRFNCLGIALGWCRKRPIAIWNHFRDSLIFSFAHVPVKKSICCKSPSSLINLKVTISASNL